VLSGKRSLREAYTNPASTRVMNAQVHAFAERWAVLAEEEKAELGAESATADAVRHDDDGRFDRPILRTGS